MKMNRLSAGNLGGVHACDGRPHAGDAEVVTQEFPGSTRVATHHLIRTREETIHKILQMPQEEIMSYLQCSIRPPIFGRHLERCSPITFSSPLGDIPAIPDV